MLIEKLNTLLATAPRDSFEYLISLYLLKEGENLANKPIKDIQKEIGVSKTTLTRFCHKVGLSKFSEVTFLLFYELVDFKNTITLSNDNSSIKTIETFLNGKKRIIVLGDAFSICSLLSYKQLFLLIGIDLEIILDTKNKMEIIKELELSKEDIVFFISLNTTNLKLCIDIFASYQEIIKEIARHDVPVIYVGKESSRMTYESYLYDLYQGDLKPSQSVLIYRLCCLFEDIYKYYMI